MTQTVQPMVQQVLAAPETDLAAHVRSLPWTGLVDLDQVWAYVLPAYGGDTLEEATQALLQWPAEADIVAALKAELAEALARDPHATFSDPVCVDFVDPDEWDDLEDDEEMPCLTLPRVGNGMHRLAAARLAGATRVLVTTNLNPDGTFTSLARDDADDEYVRVELAFSEIPLDAVDEDERDHPDVGFAASWLRSFRLNRDVWVEAVGTSACARRVSSTYLCPRAAAPDLLAAIVDRCVARGVTATVVSHRCLTGREWDAELES